MSDDPLEILRGLDSPDEAQRRQALFAVAEAREVRAVPRVRRMAAEDPSIEVRYYARKALMVLAPRDPPPHGPPLPGALGDPDPQRRSQAVKTLAARGDEAGRRQILALAAREDDPFVRATLASAIGQVGTAEDLPFVDDLLKDPDPRVRANAIEAVMRIGGAEGPVRVVPFLKDSDNRVKVNAYTALGKFKRIELLKSLGDMLAADKLWVRDSAAYALVKLEIADSVPLLERALVDAYAGVRLKGRNGLVALARRGVALARQALVRLGGERDHPEAYLTLDMLAPRGGTASSAADERAKRLQLIRRIVEANDRSRVPMLVRQLGRETRPKVLASLLTALGELGEASVVASLVPFLESPDRRIRANALEAVAKLAGEKAKEPIARYARDPDNRVRANAVVALGRCGVSVRGYLEAMAGEPAEAMRLSAIYAAVELAEEDAIPMLAGLLLDQASAVRKKAIEGLRILAGEGMAPARQALLEAGLPAAAAS